MTDAALVPLAVVLCFLGVVIDGMRRRIASLEARHAKLVELALAVGRQLDSHLAWIKAAESRLAKLEAPTFVDRNGLTRRACE